MTVRAAETPSTLRPELARSPHASEAGGPVVGVEHEYRVLDGVTQVDFRAVLPALGLGVARLDPLDEFAYRLPTGSVVTCDGREAEVAIPPEPVASGFSTRAAARADQVVQVLRAVVPSGWELHGHSTHISISVPGPDVVDVARLISITVAPALLLLSSAPDAGGVMVRPRPRRLELAYHHIPASRLAEAVTFAAGCALHACDVVAGAREPLPALQVDRRPAAHRPGWFVDARAGGGLLTRGREATLVCADGEPVTAQRVLADGWTAARTALERRGVEGDELISIDELVAGIRPVPVDASAPADAVPPSSVNLPPSPFGSMLAPRRRRGFELAPVLAAWDLSVFVVVSRSRRRRAFAAVPREDLPAFLERLDAGALDGHFRNALRRAVELPHLTDATRAGEPALFGSLGARSDLLAPEPALLPAERATTPFLQRSSSG